MLLLSEICHCDTLKSISDNMFEYNEKFLCNYDSLKEEYCKDNKCKSLTSCDGLYYKDMNFYFIEFKDLKKIKKDKDIKKFVKEHIDNNDKLLNKIDESKHILDYYIHKYDRDIKFKSQYFYYVVVTWPEVNSSENIYLKMKILSSKPTNIKKETFCFLKKKIDTKIKELKNKVYFLKDCDYLEKNEFLEKNLYWSINECKGV